MDFDLTDEQRAVVDTVRAFVERELMPHEDEVERLDEVPSELASAIRAKALSAGLYAANMPEELGGGGLDAVTLTLVERELGKTSFALHHLVSRPSNILLGCTGDQVDRYLLPTIRGERHDCLAMTEPGAGSDVRGMSTKAEPEGDGWLINGTKHFISHADISDFIILFAATGEEDTARGPRKLISAFLVDADVAGLTITRGSPSVSHRGYHHCELHFEQVRVGADALLGDEGKGFELMGQWLGATRLAVAANSVGRAQRVLATTLDWAAARHQFGQPVGRFQGLGFQLADSAVEIEAAQLLTLQAAARADAGTLTDIDVAMAKLYATEALGRLTDRAVQTFGGMGLVQEYLVERWWRDARVERIWDGTSEIQRHIISRGLLRPLEARAR
ncbi:MAG: acyl-CoA dehydrogenase family protein [Actinomycetota bacterium]|nr:acyl-CoA dehydrogenase family protein [Actinomycetota bacterium]MDH4352617.1 acyl-CoA dehydrogenase family protein [Actinomycetota bacterium]MDH5277977.1 acyl-CoA dehydrogenase family protein [Actinomycetota bacterium]